MTDLAYMVREDWARQGTAMAPSSARIREWLGPDPYLFAVTDVRKFNDSGHNASVEAARYILPGTANPDVVDIAEMPRLAKDKRAADVAVVVLHPFPDRDYEALAAAIDTGGFGRAFVLVWTPQDIVRLWLDARGAVNLYTGTPLPVADPLLVAAGKMMVSEEYNGLSGGRGKDTVIQLLRAFAASGYPLDEDAWLRAYFAAGGGFRYAGSISNFVREMKSGVKHRVETRYRDDIVGVLRERIEKG